MLYAKKCGAPTANRPYSGPIDGWITGKVIDFFKSGPEYLVDNLLSNLFLQAIISLAPIHPLLQLASGRSGLLEQLFHSFELFPSANDSPLASRARRSCLIAFGPMP